MQFPEFYAALKSSNPIWWDSLKVSFPHRDYDGLAKQCWSWLLSCDRLPPKSDDDWKNLRASYQKFLLFAPEVHTVQTGQTWEEPKKEEAPPLTGEARLARLKEWEKELMKIGHPERVKGNKVFHVAQQIKKIEYHPLTGRQIYERDRHIEYLRTCYNSVTKEPNESWMEEREFNKLYDEGLI